MSDIFDHALEFVLRWEGGFVNDPKDPGGATNHGISFRFLKNQAPELADIDRNGDIDADDVFAMTEANARRIYRRIFWEGLKLERLPDPLAMLVMDTAVNMGKSRAVRILQKAITAFDVDIKVDGILGPVTAGPGVRAVAPDLLAREFVVERIRQYAAICKRNETLKRFLHGWVNRTLALHEAVKPLII